MTTMYSYGAVPDMRQAEIFRSMASRGDLEPENLNSDEMIREILRRVSLSAGDR
jgi:hypothetical protein